MPTSRAWPRSWPATGYLPRQFMNQGDRLAFSNGIVVLSRVRRRADRRLPGRHPRADPALHDRRLHLVHAVADGDGVRWRRRGEPGWKPAPSSTVGALLTGVVLVIVAVTKTLEGRLDHPGSSSRHRRCASRRCAGTTSTSASQLTLRDYTRAAACTTPCIVPISGVHRAVVEALRYARAAVPTCAPCTWTSIRATDGADPARLAHVGRACPLVVLDSPYRSLMEPLLEYIEEVERGAAGRLRDRRAARVRARPLVAPPAAQPARAAHQGRAALPAEHGRHQRPVPPSRSSGHRVVTTATARVGRSCRHNAGQTSPTCLHVHTLL